MLDKLLRLQIEGIELSTLLRDGLLGLLAIESLLKDHVLEKRLIVFQFLVGVGLFLKSIIMHRGHISEEDGRLSDLHQLFCVVRNFLVLFFLLLL